MSVFENPQRGVFLSPFIKTIRGALLIRAFSLSSSVVFSSSTTPAKDLHLLVSAAISMPSMRSRADPFRKNRTVGTASIWWFMEMSG